MAEQCILYKFAVMKIVRTPDHRFENLPGFDYTPNYVEVNRLRLHYLDEGEGEVVLCLHGEPSWSYLYRKFIPVLQPHYRVICPDLPGFGRSDKPVRKGDYSFHFHLSALQGFIDALELKEITLVVQDWGGLLGLSALGQRPELFKRVVIMNTFLPIGDMEFPKAFKIWKRFALYSPIFPIGKIIDKGTYQTMKPEVIKAYDAPFPSRKYKAGARMFPKLVPDSPHDEGVPEMKQAREVLGQWQKPAIVLFSDKDPIMRGAAPFFHELIPTAAREPHITIKGGGHFLQEDCGETIAAHIHEFIRRNP